MYGELTQWFDGIGMTPGTFEDERMFKCNDPTGRFEKLRLVRQFEVMSIFTQCIMICVHHRFGFLRSSERIFRSDFHLGNLKLKELAKI